MKFIIFLLIISTLFLCAAFLGGEPNSMKGFYYLIWLSLGWYIWRKRTPLQAFLQKSPIGSFLTFYLLGLFMILLEETIAGITVNILRATDILYLVRETSQFWLNNIFLLSGFILGWYVLLRKLAYTDKEVLFFVGLFGLFSEKTYMHILGFPVMGIALLIPTMFTYMLIIFPSLLSLDERSIRSIHPVLRYTLALIVPILCSIPFVLLHGYLASIGIIDPGVLTR